MKISIFGLGYVGCVSAACLADQGHEVIGVDVSSIKVEMINQGQSPIVENGLNELISQNVRWGRLRATTSVEEAINRTDVSLICVGTPSNGNGSLDLTYVKRVSEQIGQTLAQRSNHHHLIILRSTVLPGTTEEVVIPILEEAIGGKAGQAFGIVFNPEFLREGSSIYDFHNPPYTLLGGLDQQSTEVAATLYEKIDAPIRFTTIKVAEMIKYANNAFHATKVVFANEIGNLCKAQGIDSHEVMDIFCLDHKLNLSAYYLKPGFAFGGSCLPKDLRALLYQTRHFDLKLPLLESLLPSNQHQIQMALNLIKQVDSKKVGVLGFSFKAGTDDLRESPLVLLIENLIGKGYQVRVYDRNVSLAQLQGANKVYIEKEIPHIAGLMVESIEEILAECEVIVIGNKAPEFTQVPQMVGEQHTIIDLVRIVEQMPENGYRGIAW
ncbi:MAG: UDP-glucose/GDP-mannose dehydrogenase family protein [Anaerolineae bacterium]|nr:UDP-glucose/GDP-mannose dehydrogenase family protein [Anaerolineae bacterium]